MLDFKLLNKKFLVFVLLLFAFGCKKPSFKNKQSLQKKATAGPVTVVIYSIGESRIVHADMTEEKAQIGASFYTGDRIITGTNGKVDIQANDSSVIRIRPNTILDFSRLKLTDKGISDIALTIHSGQMFLMFNHKQKEDNLSIFSQTAKATTLGTIFIVENTVNGEFVIKVIEGEVSISPRIAAIEGDNSKIITKNEQYEKLLNALSKRTTILKKNQEISYPSKEILLSAEILSESVIDNIIVHLSRLRIQPKTARYTKNDEQDINTILTVEPDIAKRMSEVNTELSSGQIDEKKAEKLDAELQEIHENLTKKLNMEKAKFTEQLIQSPKKLNSLSELIKYYEKIEKIVLTNGKSVVGAIINQEENTMIIHTDKGIRRVSKKDISEVVYDYQNKLE
ncbi:MAG: FecR domain-containing protein [Leptospiraceae bacterium]|nr:FecR domain-containing protein [Leptospiraceae bacterium]MCP5495930.1 FecR domain-containing protein [Leptospiraceae bacterium]